MDNKAIGARIEARRRELDLTLDYVAQEIGVAKSTVMRYEKGTIKKIKLPVIEAIARVLRVNPAWLCFKSESMEPDTNKSVTLDDFTYALQNEVKTLTDMDKQILLSMAKQLNDARMKKDEGTD